MGMGSNKQTAVQYIEENYSLGKTLGEIKVILATAKEMEKQQIIGAREDGIDAVFTKNEISNEQYYNETFKQ
jgi:hypothetical protein